MSALTIYPADRPQQGNTSRDFAAIAERLASIGVQFERWRAEAEFGADAVAQDVLNAYQGSIDRLKSQYGFQSVDVISLKADHPNKDQLRQKFLAEHTHADFEVRFFVEGRGLFYLHVEDQVYAVLCEQGDLIRWACSNPAPVSNPPTDSWPTFCNVSRRCRVAWSLHLPT